GAVEVSARGQRRDRGNPEARQENENGHKAFRNGGPQSRAGIRRDDRHQKRRGHGRRFFWQRLKWQRGRRRLPNSPTPDAEDRGKLRVPRAYRRNELRNRWQPVGSSLFGAEAGRLFPE